MKIQISNKDKDRLEWLAKEWYRVSGEKPPAISTIVHRLIERKWNEANPTRYQSKARK